MNINVEFCRTLLRLALDDIKPLTSGAERKAAWVYNLGNDSWEFHGPDGYYWYGDAGNAYDARAKGWQAWRDHLKVEDAELRARAHGQKLRAQAVQSAAINGRSYEVLYVCGYWRVYRDGISIKKYQRELSARRYVAAHAVQP